MTTLREDEENTITLNRPTGPRITTTPPRSLGELVVQKTKNTLSTTRSTTRKVTSSISRYKALLIPLVTAIGIHFGSPLVANFVTTQSSALTKYLYLSMESIVQISSQQTWSGGGAVPAPSGGGGGGFQGVGDVVVSSSWWGWYSCARAYNAAYANGTNSLCDLQAKGNGAAVCTLRVLTTGFVDLAASYCAGTTPAAACAAANGGSCIVSKAYDQTGNGRDLGEVLGNSPDLTFSAMNGLPGMDCAGRIAGVCRISSGVFTLAQPYNLSLVVKPATVGVLAFYQGADNVNVDVGDNSGPTMIVGAPTGVGTHAIVSGTPYSVQSLVNNTSCAINVNGTEDTGTCGANTFSGSNFRLHRASGAQDDAVIMEGGMLADTSTVLNTTQRNAIVTNQRSASFGYNF